MVILSDNLMHVELSRVADLIAEIDACEAELTEQE